VLTGSCVGVGAISITGGPDGIVGLTGSGVGCTVQPISSRDEISRLIVMRVLILLLDRVFLDRAS